MLSSLTMGCLSPQIKLNNLDWIVAHPEWKQAVKAAPDLVPKMAETIIQLETKVETLENR